MNAYSTTTTSLSDLATPLEVLTAINQGINDAITAGGTNYLGAVDSLIELCIAKGACFSSGEIAAWIRTYRPDMTFNHNYDIGNRVRTRYSQGMPSYASGKVLQVSRYTAGFSTTTVGHLVYVYAPSKMAGQAHPFEVTAPDAGGAIPTVSALPTMPVQSDTPVKPAATRTRRTTARRTTRRRTRRTSRRRAANAARPNVATVHGNGRLCVPRSSFEALSARLPSPIQGGSPVYVARDGDSVQISMDPIQGADQYTLVASRMRLLFASRSGTAFVPGKRYSVTITDTGLTLDLSAEL